MNESGQEILARLKEMEKRILILEAERQIENVMGRYAFYQSAGDYEKIVQQLYSREKDRSYEEGCRGIFRDNAEMPERILAFYKKRYGLARDPENEDMTRGRLVINALTSPVIYVDEDLCHAKAVWITTGHETYVAPARDCPLIPSLISCEPDSKGRKHIAEWVWQKYEGIFVREDGKWKIHDLHVYDIFRCPFDEDWVSYAEKRFEDDLVRDELLGYGKYPFPPCTGTTYHWQYTPDAFPPKYPVIPSDEE